VRLWDSQSTSLDEAVLAFTVGDDPILDRELLPYDCLASAAHAEMLAHIGILSADEFASLEKALGAAFRLATTGQFEIFPEQEDGHTALEAFLTRETGEAGEKIHTGRSRNDQVIAALRLLVRDRLLRLLDAAEPLFRTLVRRQSEHCQTLMPGYTHTRQAMPSTAGQLFGSLAEGMVADLEQWLGPLAIANRSALGSASGYGVPLPLDRLRVAASLGLDGVEVNTIQVQNSRGKLEATVLFGLHQFTISCARFATDVITLSAEAGLFSLPLELTTGSSIMPQKRNPDLLELVRAVPAAMLGRYVQASTTLGGLTSGYHRDLQRTKSPLLAGLAEAGHVITIMERAADGVDVDAEACLRALETSIFATDQTYKKVRDGDSFRSAYRAVKETGSAPMDTDEVLGSRTHLGAPGTDQSEHLSQLWDGLQSRFQTFRDGNDTAKGLLSEEA